MARKSTRNTMKHLSVGIKLRKLLLISTANTQPLVSPLSFSNLHAFPNTLFSNENLSIKCQCATCDLKMSSIPQILSLFSPAQSSGYRTRGKVGLQSRQKSESSLADGCTQPPAEGRRSRALLPGWRQGLFSCFPLPQPSSSTDKMPSQMNHRAKEYFGIRI